MQNWGVWSHFPLPQHAYNQTPIPLILSCHINTWWSRHTTITIKCKTLTLPMCHAPGSNPGPNTVYMNWGCHSATQSFQAPTISFLVPSTSLFSNHLYMITLITVFAPTYSVW
jgi:hypothetical protein